MKQKSKWLVAALAVTCGLTAIGSAQGQGILLSGIDVSGQSGYGSWLTAAFASGASVGSAGTGGVQVQASSTGFGGTYLDLGAGATAINSSSTQATLTFTINGLASNYIWMGVPLSLNDGSGAPAYGGVYSGSGNPGNPPNAVWTGNTVSIIYQLNAAQLAAIQAGTDVLYGFNIGVDPATIGVPNMDITFNSLTFSSSLVPEPTTVALAGLGGASLLLLRRRNK